MAGIFHFQHKSLAKKLAILWWILLYSLLCNYDLQENSYEADEIAFQQTLKKTGIEFSLSSVNFVIIYGGPTDYMSTFTSCSMVMNDSSLFICINILISTKKIVGTSSHPKERYGRN